MGVHKLCALAFTRQAHDLPCVCVKASEARYRLRVGVVKVGVASILVTIQQQGSASSKCAS